MEPSDRVTDLLIDALRQALAVPGEHRLYRAGKLDGLFPGRTAASSEAAARALGEELLRRSRVETRGKVEIDWVEITPKGVEFLHEHESPLAALHELCSALATNRQAVPVWLEAMRGALRDLDARLSADAGRWQQRLEAMERRVHETLRRLEAAAPLVSPDVLEAHAWAVDALNYLDRRRSAGGADPCPLPELFAAVRAHHPELSIAAFHDGLRRMNQRRALSLRPVEDPTQMSRPEFALLEGDCVYYVAVR